MKITRTLAIVVAASFLTAAAAQAQTSDRPLNMNGDPIVATHSEGDLMTGRSSMSMHKRMMMKKKMMMMRHHHHHMMMKKKMMMEEKKM